MRERKYLGLCLCTLLWWAGGTAYADAEHMLQQVRMSVAHYDLGEGGTIDTLERVSAALNEGFDDRNVEREVRFLRAAVSADMLFVSAYRADDTVRERLSRLWGSDGSDLTFRIREELLQADGIYAGPAARIAGRLALVDGMGALRWNGLAKASGAWRDVALLRKVVHDLDKRKPREVLGELVQDPCGKPEAECDAMYQPFDAVSRRRMAGLSAIGSAHARVIRNCEAGDPLANLLQADVAADFERLADLEVLPTPRLQAGAKVDVSPDNIGRVPFQVLVHVSREAVEYGYVPAIRLDEAGEIETHELGQPTLPAVRRIELPSQFRPYMHPVDDLVVAFRDEGLKERAVGVTTDAGVPAHLVGRVFLSLRRAGLAEAALVGRGDSDEALGVPLRLVVGDEADAIRPRPDVAVRVRLGGYSLRLGGWALDIPRVRGDSGRFEFDTASLQQRVAKRRIRSSAVSFMSNVAVENVLAAVWRVAPDSERLNLVMP